MIRLPGGEKFSQDASVHQPVLQEDNNTHPMVRLATETVDAAER
jgi:hypothetical protein